EKNAFKLCTSLADMVLPDTLNIIGESAFYGCESLTAVTIPSGLNSIGDKAFANCTALKSFSVPYSVWFTTSDGVLYDRSMTKLIQYPPAKTYTSYWIVPKVTEIAPFAFSGSHFLEEIHFQSDAPSIGEDAFYGVTATAYYPGAADGWTASVRQQYGGNITWQATGSSCGTCGDGVSWSFDADIKRLTISGSGAIEESPSYLVYSGEIQSVVIENGVTEIGEKAFYACTAMKGITIPSTVHTIGQNAFFGCQSLTGITIPEGRGNPQYGTFYIDSYAFQSCSGLTEIKFLGAVPEYGTTPFYNVGGVTLKYPSLDTTWTETIRNRLFSDFTGKAVSTWTIESYTNPSSGACGDSVTWSVSGSKLTISGTGPMWDFSEINYDAEEYTGYQVFRDSITEVEVNGVTTLGECAFRDMNKLQQVILPSSLTRIDYGAFFGCSALSGVVIPAGVTLIGNVAFSDCNNLFRIRFSGDMPTMYSYSFINDGEIHAYYPQGNTTWIPLAGDDYGDGDLMFTPYDGTSGSCGENVTWSLSRGTLTISGSGEMADYDEEMPPYDAWWDQIIWIKTGNFVTRIGAYAFFDLAYVTSVTTGNSLISIGDSAFCGCGALTDLTLGSEVRTIEPYAFAHCKSMTSVTLPDTVTSIGGNAFFNCRALQSITFPGSVENIGNWAFSSCSALKTIRFEGDPPSFGSKAFSGVTATASYRSGNPNWTSDVMQDYGGTITWETFGSTSGTCGTNVNWIVSNGRLIISGSGAMTDFTETNRPVYDELSNFITSVMVTSGVTKVGNYAFSGLKRLNSVTFQSTVAGIGDSAFDGCRALSSILLPSSLRTIGEGAFRDCRALTSITIPEGVTAIPKNAFASCTDLKSISIPDTVTSIGENAFSNCCRLASVSVPDSVTEIGRGAFSLCFELQYAKLPSGLTVIEPDLFSACVYNLKSISIPDGVIRIGYGAFQDCEALTSLTIPASVEYIGTQCFTLCRELAAVRFLGSAPFFQPDNDGTITLFKYVDGLTVYYPADDPSWTAEVRQSYGGTNVVWLPDTGAALEIIMQPGNQTVAEGATATFKVVAAGTGLTYQWQYKVTGTSTWINCTSATAGYNTATLKVVGTTTRNGYQYRCIVKDGGGTSVTSNAATLTVTSGPTITTQPGNQTVAEGATATFKVVAT
ncbi:MAG: leucine-rich repeat domain-containing protein, partial [Oscillospiraceae bacterium]|nr:leucine-rich repeat domain-containing protein [Oscillospiraceae bacterium]